ncbi:hypothetical protein I8J34_12000 [Denitromonas sp. IR12]|uniref:Uncharacterized protein n=2 Tax=Denitromonas iodatirespirans TaxID=2795389 RepID=A0A944D8R3_DENI1|nr:hypothetical protein [Denitromonas iodatirespirans]
MVDECLARGELVAPFGTDGIRLSAYYLVWPEGRPVSASAGAVLRWMTSQADAGVPGD